MAARRQQNSSVHEETPRGRILAAAAHLFRTKGFERATVRDLAREVGIQSGSIFHHFRTKEDILKEVMIDVILFNTERMKRSIAEAKSLQDKLLALIYCELLSINGDTGEAMAVLISEWRSLSADNQAYILGLRANYEALWIEVLDALKAEGRIAAEVDTFILRRFLTGALGASNFWYNPEGSMSIEVLARQAVFMVLKS